MRAKAISIFSISTSDRTSSNRNIIDISIFAAVSAVAVLLYAVSTAYWSQVIALFAINALLIMSYRLIVTMGGWSFAHVSFAAIGAYTLALLTTVGQISFWLALILGCIFAGVVAIFVAYPVLRTRQYNFFLSTFAAAAAIQQSLIQFPSATGGNNGIAFIPRPQLFFGMSADVGYFVVILALTSLTGLLLRWIDRARLGMVIKAVALNEQLSESVGINTWWYRSLAFVIGSAIAGLGGGLLAGFNGIVNPADFSPTFMFKIVAAAIVGGTQTFVGPILGLFYLTAIEEIFRSTAEFIPLFWGGSVIAIILFSNGGLEGLALHLKRKIANLVAR